jgi:hypothetical protein
MKTITRLLATAALLFGVLGGANSVKAKTIDVNLSSLPATSQNTTWSWNAGTSTGTFGWTETSYNSTELFSAGDYSAYTTLNLKTAAGTTDHFRILVDFSNGTGQLTINPVAVGNVSITLTNYITLANLACVSSIRLSGANDATGNIKVSRIYLEGPDYIRQTTVKVAPDGVTNMKGLQGAGNYTWNISYPVAIGESTEIGGGIDNDNHSVNISSYDYLVFVVSEASYGAKVYLRTFVSTASSNDNSTRVILYPHPIADYASVENWTTETAITAPGVYVVKISDYPLLRGIKNTAHFQVPPAAGTAKISLAYLCSGSSPAAPVDQIARVGEGARTDASATWFDVTGLTESGITYNATNLNALFVVTDDDELTNTNNVIVSGTCANFALTDGNYPFKAYNTFTATNASYNRSFKAGARSTLCLPFALTAEEAAAAGKFYELSGVNAAGTELTFTEVIASGTTAYKPYIFEATADGTPFSTYSSKSIAATPNSLAFTGTTVEGYTLTGVLTGSSDVAADHAGKTVYGWSANSDQEGTFVRVGTGVSINPFRAYVVYDGGSGSSPARMAVRFDGDDITGINERSESQSIWNAIGKYVENGKIVIFKNGMKFNANGQQIK